VSKVRESLEANKEEILKALPEEHHAHLEKEIQTAEDAMSLSDEEELGVIKAELINNPDIHEAGAIAELENNPTAHRPAPAPSEEEQEKEMAERLKEAQAGAE